MKIYTTYFGNLTNLPDSVVPIAVCGNCKFWNGLRYKALAPKYWWWKIWKDEGMDTDYYTKMYKTTVLDTLIPLSVVRDLETLSGGKDVALVCYEVPSAFCHRHLIASWLGEAGYNVEEWIN